MPCYLSIGSNLGDRLRNLQSAVIELERAGIQILSNSAVYETEPVDCPDDSPLFLNAVLETKINCMPSELIKSTLNIEQKIGRIRNIKNNPRIIDIDILMLDDKIICDEKLTVPHPRMCERLFVLAPLKEIAGEFIHPLNKKTVNEIYNQALKRTNEEVKLFAPSFAILEKNVS